MQKWTGSSADQTQRSALETEIAILEELQITQFLDLVEAMDLEARAVYAKTWKGRYFNALGYLFSLYCVYKIAIVSTWLGLAMMVLFPV